MAANSKRKGGSILLRTTVDVLLMQTALRQWNYLIRPLINNVGDTLAVKRKAQTLMAENQQ